jgi:hypothetical protein
MKTPLTAAVFCLALGGAALAQTWEVSFSPLYPRISPTPLGSISEEDKKDDDTKLKALSGYGARLTWNTRGYYGHEIGFNYIRARLTSTVRTTEDDVTVTTVLEDRVPVRQAYYNFLMYFMPKGERWRPFVTGGFQATEYGAPGFEQWPTGKSRNYGFNYGGGIKLRLVPHALLRLDVRDYIGGKPYDLESEDLTKFGGRIRMFEASAGIVITFKK